VATGACVSAPQACGRLRIDVPAPLPRSRKRGAGCLLVPAFAGTAARHRVPAPTIDSDQREEGSQVGKEVESEGRAHLRGGKQPCRREPSARAGSRLACTFPRGCNTNNNTTITQQQSRVCGHESAGPASHAPDPRVCTAPVAWPLTAAWRQPARRPRDPQHGRAAPRPDWRHRGLPPRSRPPSLPPPRLPPPRVVSAGSHAEAADA
jgi:hypothetical protein